MAEKKIYIGSYGPYLYDDDVGYDDPDDDFVGETQKAFKSDGDIDVDGLLGNYLGLYDTDQSNLLSIIWNEDDISDRALNLLVSGGDRSLTIENDSIIDQDYSSDASPIFFTVQLSDVTEGNIPYDSATGLADSPLSTDGTHLISTGNLTLPDSGYIKSTTGNNAIQIMAGGSVNFSQGLVGTASGSYNLFLGSSILGGPPASQTYNIAIGTAFGESAVGNVSSNLIMGTAIAGDSTGNLTSNLIMGSTIADATTTNLTQNLIIGDNILQVTTGGISQNLILGGNIGQTATGNNTYNLIIGYSVGAASTGYFNNNLMIVSSSLSAFTGNFTGNLLIGSGIANKGTGNCTGNLAVGSNIGNNATGLWLNNSIVGGPQCNSITGNFAYNVIHGNYHCNSLTGAMLASVVLGSTCVFNTTNATNFNYGIAMPYDSLRESTASDIDYAIAIGYRAGYQNSKTNPALFGRQATATADKQVVIGSTYYTGGLLIDLGNGATSELKINTTSIYAATESQHEYKKPIVLSGSGRVKREFAISPSDYNPGASGPTAALQGGFESYEFTIGDDMYASFEIPYDWDSSTDITVEIYWGIDEAYATNNGEVQWYADWYAVAVGEDVTSPGNTGSIDFGDIDIPASANDLVKTEGTIAAASLAAGDVVSLHGSRVALDDGNNPTAEPYIIQIHVEYTANTLGDAV